MTEETSISRNGTFKPGSLGSCLDEALTEALALKSQLPDWVLDIQGMSGRLYRRFINNLVRSVPQPRYLEVGSWAGSTACAAMAGNAVKVTCIDDWSLFDGPRDLFLANAARARSEAVDFLFVESDFRALDFALLGRYNLYLFDGPHEYVDQYDGVRIAQCCLDDEYILVVDDWNWEPVRKGTWDALADCGCEVLYDVEIRTTQDDTHPVKSFQKESSWHNGYFIAHVRKRASDREVASHQSTRIEQSLRSRITAMGDELASVRQQLNEVIAASDANLAAMGDELASVRQRLNEVIAASDANLAALERAEAKALAAEDLACLLTALSASTSASGRLRLAGALKSFRPHLPPLEDDFLIDGLYRLVLGRTSDQTGAEHYRQILATHGPMRVLSDLIRSQESRERRGKPGMRT